MMAGPQASDWYQAWPVGWSESQDMVESILGQTSPVSGRFTDSLTLSHVCISSLVSSFFFYFYLLFNRLTFFFSTYVTSNHVSMKYSPVKCR